MKKIILIAMLLIGSTVVSTAQSASDVRKALNIYVSPTFGGPLGGMINAEFEMPMFVDNLTIAPYVGAGVASYNVWVNNGNNGNNTFPGGGYVRKSVALLNVGVVGHYYFDWLIPNMPDKFDVFAKAKAASRFRLGGNDYVYESYVPIYVSIKAGGRVNFTPSFSLYGAVGYGHSSFDFGLTLKM